MSQLELDRAPGALRGDQMRLDVGILAQQPAATAGPSWARWIRRRRRPGADGCHEQDDGNGTRRRSVLEAGALPWLRPPARAGMRRTAGWILRRADSGARTPGVARLVAHSLWSREAAGSILSPRPDFLGNLGRSTWLKAGRAAVRSHDRYAGVPFMWAWTVSAYSFAHRASINTKTIWKIPTAATPMPRAT